MKYKQLGKELKISAIGLGAMPLSISGRPSESDAIAVIHQALDSGVTLIDTADSYCQDESDKHHNEKLIAKALQQYQGDTSAVTVATKGGVIRPQGSWQRDGNPERLRTAIRQSYEALGGSQAIGVWQYHAPDTNYTIEEALTPAKEAVDEGLIRYVGVSNFTVEQIERARKVIDIVSVQNQYNPWHRQPEVDGVLDYCQREGLIFFPYSPLGGSSRVDRLQDIKVIAEIAKERAVSVYQIVLSWLRGKYSCVVPIPGASRVSSIEDSVKAADLELSNREVERIDRETQ
ncbi:aldo/keto reductase [Myxosarcina sp. GI1]|uniref:aldo/keto reductase n=1 Tax=Myxosarcina sp. GI1 TaxID=1541065 RepID=UPI000563BE5C|nr:aldo/keto reductase [Myxosarcina sp. GI1]